MGGQEMKSRRLAVTALLLSLAAALAASPPETGWEPVDAVFGGPGKDLPGNVRRYGWPRTDIHMTIGGVPVEPGLALGAWAGFMKTPGGNEAITMGDLVVLESELAPVLGQLESGGFEILAIHNHLAGENPHVLYVHFHGHEDPATLAKTLKAALAKTGTPPPGGATAKATPEQEKIFAALQDALGLKGTNQRNDSSGQRRARRTDSGRGNRDSARDGHEQSDELPDRRRTGGHDRRLRASRR
jgi:hypothetical protein